MSTAAGTGMPISSVSFLDQSTCDSTLPIHDSSSRAESESSPATTRQSPRRTLTVSDRENNEEDREYDSGGGSCFDAILNKEGEQDFNDNEELPVHDTNTGAHRLLPHGSIVACTTPVGTFVDIEDSKLWSLNVVALRHELKIRGKKVKGTKLELQFRLRQAIAEKAVLVVSAGESSQVRQEERSKERLVGFPPILSNYEFRPILSNYEFRMAIVMAYMNPKKAYDPTFPMSENANSTGLSCNKNRKRKHFDSGTSTDGGATGETSVAHPT